MSQADFYLKIAGVDGESSDSKHKGEIELESWSFGATQTGVGHSGGGGGAGKVAMQDFHFVMKVSKASPKLFMGCASGEHFKDATLVARKAGKEQQEYLKIKLTDILVSSYQQGGSAGSNIVPTDQVSLNFAMIEIDYKEQKSDGSLGGAVQGSWNLKENKPK